MITQGSTPSDHATTDCDEYETIIPLEGEVAQKWFVALK